MLFRKPDRTPYTGDITDFHTHILPGMDDGAKDEQEALALLSSSYAMGVRTLVFTPHFYPDRDRPEAFLARREAAAQRLLSALAAQDTPLPRLILGAEIAYFHGISTSDALPLLAVEGTNVLLVEMPFARWRDSDIEEIVTLAREGYTPVLAHIERYFGMVPKAVWERLSAAGVLFQTNAVALYARPLSYTGLSLLRKGRIACLGSDTHDTSHRAPDLDCAVRAASDAGLSAALAAVFARAEALLSDAVTLTIGEK